MACEHSAGMSLTQLALSTNLAFNWKHPVWNTDKLIVSKIPARAYDKEGAETLKWILDQVTPALKKAHVSGLWNVYHWLKDEWDINLY